MILQAIAGGDSKDPGSAGNELLLHSAVRRVR